MAETFQIVLPQTVLAACACLMILGGAFSIARRVWGYAALAALGASGAALWWSSGTLVYEVATSLSVSRDPISLGFEWSCLVIGVLLVLMAMESQAAAKTAAEFYGMLLLVISGMMLAAAADDLVLLFLSLELISIPTYVLLYLGRRDYASQEATVKYFMLSVLSGATLLYGFAFVYGLAGSTRLVAIYEVLRNTYQPAQPGTLPVGGSVLGVLAVVLIVAGLGFKLAAVPFHFYAPDVYEGTSAFNAGLLAITPKAAALLVLLRVVNETMVGFEAAAQQLVLIIAAITMTGGNCLALLQTNVRRLLAYSSIAHAGYMLMGVAVGFWESWNEDISLGASPDAAISVMSLPGGYFSSLLYLLAYCLATLGFFAVLVYLGRPGKQLDHIDELTGLAKSHPLLAIMAALFLFSLAGIPPLPGFWAKLSVFAAALSVRQDVPATLFAMHPAFVVLAVVGVVNAAIGAVVYLRLVALMFLNDPVSTARSAGGRPAYAAVACSAVLVLAFSFLPRPVFTYLQDPRPPRDAIKAAGKAPATHVVRGR